MKEVLFFRCAVPSLGSQILSFPCDLIFLFNLEEMLLDYVSHEPEVYMHILKFCYKFCCNNIHRTAWVGRSSGPTFHGKGNLDEII